MGIKKIELGGGGGASGVTSVNGETGAVTLTYSDIGRRVVRLSSATPSTSTTPADLSGMSFSIENGKTYKVELIGTYQTAVTTTGARICLKMSSGNATIQGTWRGAVSALAVTTELAKTINKINSTYVAADQFVTTGVNAINTAHYIGAIFIITATSNGVVQLGWGSEVASSAATLNAGYSIIIEEL